MRRINSPSRLPLRAACPGSARIEADSPPIETEVMRAGKELHERIAAALHADAADVPEDIADAVAYIRTLRERFGAQPLVEQEIDLEWLDPSIGRGTVDCALVTPGGGAVVDWKTGWGGARADSHLQLLAYAAGLAVEHDLTVVEAHLVPLRIGRPCVVTLDDAAITDAVERLRYVARAALDPDARLVPGEWCAYCTGSHACPALRDQVMTLDIAISPEHLPGHVLSNLLHRARLARVWCGRLEEYAHRLALGGRSIPGWTLRPGRRTREWADRPDLAEALRAAAIAAGMHADELFERTLRSPAQVEHLVGKKAFASLSHLVATRTGKPRLEPLDEKEESDGNE